MSESSTEIFSDKVMAKIWQRMAAIYGHKWTSHLGVASDAEGKLSESAKVWKQGLIGVTLDQVKYGFTALVIKHHDWPPSLPEFRKLCVSGNESKAPSLDEVISTLVLMPRTGSIAKRYKHPFILAASGSVDMFLLRTAKLVDAKRMVKPVYERILADGWPDFPPHAHIEQKAISSLMPITSREAGLKAFQQIRGAL